MPARVGGEVTAARCAARGQRHARATRRMGRSAGSTWVFVANWAGLSGLQLGLVRTIDRNWRRAGASAAATSPAVANGVLYHAGVCASGNGECLVARNPATGDVLWNSPQIGRTGETRSSSTARCTSPTTTHGYGSSLHERPCSRAVFAAIRVVSRALIRRRSVTVNPIFASCSGVTRLRRKEPARGRHVGEKRVRASFRQPASSAARPVQKLAPDAVALSALALEPDQRRDVVVLPWPARSNTA